MNNRVTQCTTVIGKSVLTRCERAINVVLVKHSSVPKNRMCFLTISTLDIQRFSSQKPGSRTRTHDCQYMDP